MREIATSIHAEGALYWSPDGGYALEIPETDQMPDPIKVLTYCFIRLCEDPEFGNELQAWVKRNQN